jgi:hypothetical protein
VRTQIGKLLALAGRWPLCTTLAIVSALALSYEVGLRADAAAPAGRFQLLHRAGEDNSFRLPSEGFDTATGLQCLTQDPRNRTELNVISKMIPFCVDLLNDRTLAGRMHRRLPY